MKPHHIRNQYWSYLQNKKALSTHFLKFNFRFWAKQRMYCFYSDIFFFINLWILFCIEGLLQSLHVVPKCTYIIFILTYTVFWEILNIISLGTILFLWQKCLTIDVIYSFENNIYLFNLKLKDKNLSGIILRLGWY